MEMGLHKKTANCILVLLFAIAIIPACRVAEKRDDGSAAREESARRI